VPSEETSGSEASAQRGDELSREAFSRAIRVVRQSETLAGRLALENQNVTGKAD
jgi:hypothetical protein